MKRLALILGILAAPAMAETAQVISGEHADFTRLVVELPQPADWTVGRTAMGYGFATKSVDQPGYDLARVWDRIPRTRLQGLRVDPGTGALMLSLACDCHVFPFEYLPGTIVLDIRDGAAPPGSVFEAAFSQSTGLPARDSPPLAVAALAYSWLELPRETVDETAMPKGLEYLRDRPTVPLDPLRDELLLQLSRGVADGIVEMVLPGKPGAPEVEGMGDLSGALVRIGELPGLEIVDRDLAADEGPRDESCLRDDAIDLPAWGNGRPALELLAEGRSGLYGELDLASPDALRRAIEVHLYLGFGAEALQYGKLIPGSGQDPTLAPLLSMARLVDGESDPTSPFAGMLGCDGSAALWAALAHSGLPAGARVNINAIVRSFQALPPHLRRHLGPRLAGLLLDRDAEAARMIRNAVERSPDVPAGTVALMDAKADLQAELPVEALGHAETAVQEEGAGLQGLMALVEAHFQSQLPLPPDVADSLLAYREIGADEKDQHARALVLALALSGRVGEAFKLSDPDDPVRADLWRTVVRLAEDGPFLAEAVLRPTDLPPAVDGDVALAVSGRLADLGFPEAALVWLGQVDTDSEPDRRLVAAKAELGLGNARQALQLLSGLAGSEALDLRVGASRQLGAYADARQALDGAGRAEDSIRLAIWDSRWEEVQNEGAPAWAAAAALLAPGAADAPGPLAAGHAAVDESAAARRAISVLLADVPDPAP